jgi:nitrite reductase (NADH) large subunit
MRDAKRGVYKRVVIQNNKVCGAVLYGDVKDGPWYLELMSQQRDIGPMRDKLLFGAAFAGYSYTASGTA